MTEHLDLNLTDEEIAESVTKVIDGTGPLPSAEEMARGVADRATAKAAWGCVDWLMGQQDADGFYTEWAMAEALKLELNAAGIPKSEGGV